MENKKAVKLTDFQKNEENPIKQYNTKLKRHGELIEMLLFF